MQSSQCSQVPLPIHVGALLYIKSTFSSVFLSNVTATVEGGSIVDFLGQGYLVGAVARGIISAGCVATAVRSSNVTLGGDPAAHIFLKSSNANTGVFSIAATVEGGSAVVFSGTEGYLVLATGVNCTATCLNTNVRSSNMNMTVGALFFMQSTSGSVVLSNATAIVERSIVNFASEGYIALALAVSFCSSSGLSASLVSSCLSVWGGTGGYSTLSRVHLSNATVTIEGGSYVRFGGQGYLVLALALQLSTGTVLLCLGNDSRSLLLR